MHIADVSHFIRHGTAIDREAAARGTTVYLCDKVPLSLSYSVHAFCSKRRHTFAGNGIHMYCAAAKCISVYIGIGVHIRVYECSYTVLVAYRHGARAAQLESVFAAMQRGALRLLLHLDSRRRGAHSERSLHEERDSLARMFPFRTPCSVVCTVLCSVVQFCTVLVLDTLNVLIAPFCISRSRSARSRTTRRR